MRLNFKRRKRVRQRKRIVRGSSFKTTHHKPLVHLKQAQKMEVQRT